MLSIRLVLLSSFCLPATPLAAQHTDPVVRAGALIDLRQIAEARRFLEPHARANPDDARAAKLMGRIDLEEDRTDSAIEWLERAVRLDDRSADHHYLLGVAYGLKAQRVNVLQQARLAGRAKGALERAVALDPDHVLARHALLQFHLLAPRILGGDREEARRQAAEIRRRNAYHGSLAYGALHADDKDHAAAIAEFESAMQQYPDSAAPVLALGRVLDRIGRREAALDAYEAFIERRPDAMPVLYQFGRLGAVMGQRLERSEEALRRYLQHQPRAGQPPLAAAHWRLAMIYEQQGQIDRAREEYQAVLTLDPRHREAREALKRLGS